MKDYESTLWKSGYLDESIRDLHVALRDLVGDDFANEMRSAAHEAGALNVFLARNYVVVCSFRYSLPSLNSN